MSKVQTSAYRQSGWKSLADGSVIVHYGDKQPADVTLFEKMWDHWITELFTKEDYAGQDTATPLVPTAPPVA